MKVIWKMSSSSLQEPNTTQKNIQNGKSAGRYILLCDIGGTHGRFALMPSKIGQGIDQKIDSAKKGDVFQGLKKYKLHDFKTFPDLITTYLTQVGLRENDIFEMRLSLARLPVDGKISVKRSAADPDYAIDLNNLPWDIGRTLHHYNDLEAAAYGLNAIDDAVHLDNVVPRRAEGNWSSNAILIAIGTGVGHALIHRDEKTRDIKQVFKTTGGHIPFGSPDPTHNQFFQFIQDHKSAETPPYFIAEDVISGRGLRMAAAFISGKSVKNCQAMSDDEFIELLKETPKISALFFELLGRYVFTLVGGSGFYGGVYINGGVIDALTHHGLADWQSFETGYRPDGLYPTVIDRLNCTPVSYVREENLPLYGLTYIR